MNRWRCVDMDITAELYKEIKIFIKWADKFYPKWSEENDNGEWEDGTDSNFLKMRKAAINVIKCFKCSDSDEKLIDALLFTIARDNECEIIINELVNYKDWYELLAKKSLGSKYINSEWQFAKKIGDCNDCDQQLIFEFIESDNEYTSRMALSSLAKLNPEYAEEYAIKFWNRNKYPYGSYEDEYQKIMVLSVLEQIKSSKLEKYLEEALKSNYKFLVMNAEEIVRTLNQK